MAEFKISRLRYTWRNQWTSSTSYNKDDVVRYGGSSWVCVRQHTASAFQTDQEFLANPGDTDFTPAWVKMTDGYAWRGPWNPSTLYNPGDVVLYGGVIYLVTVSHTSASTFIINADKVLEYVSTSTWTDDWTAATRYGIGDLAKYNGIVYRCIAEHTSGSTLQGLEIGNNDALEDSTGELWEVYNSGVEYVGEWVGGSRYRLNDLVKYGGSILRCVFGHQAGGNITNAYFINEFPGNKVQLEWSSLDYYAVGDVVQHGGYIYRANENNQGIEPSRSINDQPVPRTEWSLLSKAIKIRGDWSAAVDYKTGDLVRRGGYLYIALSDTAITGDGSTLDYLDESNWEIVVPGDAWKASWISGTEYLIGDIVLYFGNTYRNNTQHTASIDNFPGDNGSGFFYWDLVIENAQTSGLGSPGDLLTFGFSRSAIGDGSTLGPTSVPIGNNEEYLAVNSNDTLHYKTFGRLTKVTYVSSDERIALDDIDDASRGYDPEKPWRTVRFACERIHDLGDDSVLNVIKVATGLYDEVGPIIVPAGTAIEGNELRSVTIRASSPRLDLTAADDGTYQIIALDRISDIVQAIIGLTTAPRTSGNTVPQITNPALISGLENVPFSPRQFQIPAGGTGSGELPTEIFDVPVPPALLVAERIQQLSLQTAGYINFYVNSIGSQPVYAGNNNPYTNPAYRNAGRILNANKRFIAKEVETFLKDEYPSYNVSSADITKIVEMYLRGFSQDIKYAGSNYYSLEAGRWYKNLILGSQDDDMFYLRDTTGIRNLTTKGLSGTLSPPNVFELYRRPTGGAYMSLDPGWGPNDERCWIVNRSPYVQNVTTFGDNCVGQKIDGALHNGGNKSIVSNDFTQVISDGIGAWVLNNGRAELVSVFTYYAQIGMFAEDGGVIRATNGNSSYGDFGAVADGNDPTEAPLYVETNTRTTQATIASAFAGEVNDEILILEFENAGIKYTDADYTFTGSGVNAQVKQQEFRDDAVFNVVIKNFPGQDGTIGGIGYTQRGNNAQVGSTTTLTLATNEDAEEEDILGMRLIITSGQGAGQYGYVTAYNSSTKVVNVSRESDNVPGWDHVISGTPSRPQLFTDNTYRFEPRIIFSDPGFSASIVNMGDTSNWQNVAYGETYEVYNGVSGGAGTGEVIGTPAVTATFNVIKNARVYQVTLSNPGAGYEAGQELVIAGNVLGGATPENDLAITVTASSEDSTNSILGFTFQGIAASGRFVVGTGNSDKISYSSDGTNWSIAQTTQAGNWTGLAAGGTYFATVLTGSNVANYSRNGITWTASILPSTSQWKSLAYGKINGTDIFLAVSEFDDAGAYSINGGVTWTAVTLPDIGDSTFNNWQDVTFGKNKFVVVANTGNHAAVGTYNTVTNTWTWNGYIMDTIDDSSQQNWVSVAYGNQRFVAVSTQGNIAYSFDGEDWLAATAPSQDGSTAHNWKQIRYGQGLFFMVGDTGGLDIAGDAAATETNFAATSYDGVVWTNRTLSQSTLWSGIGFGNPDITLGDSTVQSNSTGMWIAVATGLDHGCKVLTGCRTLGRVIVEGSRIDQIRIWEPGSGYASDPTVTIIDPNVTAAAYVEPRRGDAVLAQPDWINRGSGYRTSSTRVTILGDGVADVIPFDKNVIVSGFSVLPGPGTQFRFRGDTLNYYTVTTVNTDRFESDGTITARFTINPSLSIDDFMEHSSQVEVRERYSQVRITGHDFLEVGTGNFTETNYPELYNTGLYVNAPENEVVELNGGRVFYTSTDQNGNFRVGELFAVEQATGVVTISAEFFDLEGLTELALGGVRLGGSGTVVREFSTDPLFTQDSNNVVPTQRAIKAYLTNRLNVGGSDLLTASFIAGTVKVGPNEINNVASLSVIFPTLVDFSGDDMHLSGSILAQYMFFKSFRDI
jgi:hypothetical protein